MSFFRSCVHFVLGVALGVALIFLYLCLFAWYVPRHYLRRLWMSADQRREEDEDGGYCLMDKLW